MKDETWRAGSLASRDNPGESIESKLLAPSTPARPRKPTSLKKIEANRRNAGHSTGPRTTRGKGNSRRNALKHGVFVDRLSEDVVLRFEDPQEYDDLRTRLRDHYQPVGEAEQLEVERIALCWWRRKRAFRYENAEICADAHDARAKRPMISRDLAAAQKDLVSLLEAAQREIEAGGQISLAELTDKILAIDKFFGTLFQDFGAAADRMLKEDSEVVPPAEHARVVALGTVKGMLLTLEDAIQCATNSHMKVRTELHAIPRSDALDKLLRYEAAIERDLGRAIDRLERLQRRRWGELVPPPLSVDLRRTT